MGSCSKGHPLKGTTSPESVTGLRSAEELKGPSQRINSLWPHGNPSASLNGERGILNESRVRADFPLLLKRTVNGCLLTTEATREPQGKRRRVLRWLPERLKRS